MSSEFVTMWGWRNEYLVVDDCGSDCDDCHRLGNVGYGGYHFGPARGYTSASRPAVKATAA